MQHDRVANRQRDRRDRVERRRQRHGAVDRHQPRRALEADQPLQRRRDADRAAGVGAERGPGGAGGDRGRAARGRAAGDARRRVERRASPGWRACRECGLMPTPEKANSRHVGAADQRGAGARAGARRPGRRRAAGGASRRTVEPAAVISPATSNRSLIETARPASGARVAPGARRRGRRRRRRRGPPSKRGRDEGAARRAASARRRSSARSGRAAEVLRARTLPARFGEVVGHRGCYNSTLCLERTICSVTGFHGARPVPPAWKPLHPRTGSSRCRGVDRSADPMRRDSSRILEPTFGNSMSITMREMLEAGVHFGHQTRLLEPEDGPVHLRPSQQDPHHQPREDACRCTRTR